MWSDIGTLISALASQDPWMIRDALRSSATWVLFGSFLIVAGFILAWIYHHVPVIERYLERTVMVTSYLAIAFIIFWGVIDRFVFNNQQPWSTTVPPLLFMIMAWFGASFNIRARTHLSFSEFRTRMGRTGQLLCLLLDFVLWFGFALILLVTTSRMVALSASNFAIVLGTDDTMQWWFLIAVPIAAVLMAGRAIENVQDDISNYRKGEPMIRQAVIGGDV